MNRDEQIQAWLAEGAPRAAAAFPPEWRGTDKLIAHRALSTYPDVSRRKHAWRELMRAVNAALPHLAGWIDPQIPEGWRVDQKYTRIGIDLWPHGSPCVLVDCVSAAPACAYAVVRDPTGAVVYHVAGWRIDERTGLIVTAAAAQTTDWATAVALAQMSHLRYQALLLNGPMTDA